MLSAGALPVLVVEDCKSTFAHTPEAGDHLLNSPGLLAWPDPTFSVEEVVFIVVVSCFGYVCRHNRVFLLPVCLLSCNWALSSTWASLNVQLNISKSLFYLITDSQFNMLTVTAACRAELFGKRGWGICPSTFSVWHSMRKPAAAGDFHGLPFTKWFYPCLSKESIMAFPTAKLGLGTKLHSKNLQYDENTHSFTHSLTQCKHSAQLVYLQLDTLWIAIPRLLKCLQKII